MKRQNFKNKNYFEVNCTLDGTKLVIEIPIHLYEDFERCLSCIDGMSTLTTLYSEFSELNPELRKKYQSLVYDFEDRIFDMTDMIYLIKALKTRINLK